MYVLARRAWFLQLCIFCVPVCREWWHVPPSLLTSNLMPSVYAGWPTIWKDPRCRVGAARIPEGVTSPRWESEDGLLAVCCLGFAGSFAMSLRSFCRVGLACCFWSCLFCMNELELIECAALWNLDSFSLPSLKVAAYLVPLHFDVSTWWGQQPQKHLRVSWYSTYSTGKCKSSCCWMQALA